MRIKIEELKNLKNLKVILAVIFIIILGTISLRIYKSLWSKNIGLKAQIARKTDEITKGTNLSPFKTTVESEIKELDAQLSSIEKRFSFNNNNTEEIFTSLNRFIEASQIRLDSISPLERTEVAIPESENKYIELPVNLKLQCVYDQLLSFLNKIENTDRMMLVTEVKIQGNPENIWEHKIDLSLKLPMVLFSAEKPKNK